MLAPLLRSLALAPTLRAALAGLLVAGPAAAQTWVPVQGTAPPGTPAELRLLGSLSSTSTTVLELEIHGFWRTTVVGADGLSYDRLDFPGLGQVGQLGAPELPAARPRLGDAGSGASLALLARVAEPAATATFTYDVYPLPLPALDGGPLGSGDPDGADETFVLDPLVYGTDAEFPGIAASPSVPLEDTWGRLRSGVAELFPARWNPVTRRLQVDGLTRYTFVASSAPTPRTVTRDLRRLGAGALANWPAVEGWYPPTPDGLVAHYLVVAPQAFVEPLAPFVLWKKQLGFVTEVRTLESLAAADCDGLRAELAAWRAGLDPTADAYCLLVGDAETIPLCPAPTAAATPSDDPYGSPAGVPDGLEELFVGRLSAETERQVAEQVAKWLAYERDGAPGNDYSVVIGAAHLDDAASPDGYQQTLLEVAAASYAAPPTFQLLPGSLATSTDAALLGLLDGPAGFLTYRGHGTSNAWPAWNAAGENLHRDEVLALTNPHPPVVWSFACNHADLAGDTSLGEAWLRAAGGGVAHYGATRNVGRRQNDALLAALFEAVFDAGVTTHGMALALAEDAMDRAHPDGTYDNAWAGLLLGDPSLRLRRAVPAPGTLVVPSAIEVDQPFTLVALAPDGAPQVGVELAAYKAPFLPDGSDEFQWTGVSGPGGTATVPGPPTIGKPLDGTKRDDDGNVIIDGGVVSKGAFTDLGDSLAGSFGIAPKLSSGSSLEPGTGAELQLAFAVPLSPGVLALSAFDSPTPIFGGILHPVPVQLQVPFATDAEGRWTLAVAPWPALPPGTQLIWQAGVLDGGAPALVALSNALRSTSP